MNAKEAKDLQNSILDENLSDVFKTIKEEIKKMNTEAICTWPLSDLEIKRLVQLGYSVDAMDNINEEKYYKITW